LHLAHYSSADDHALVLKYKETGEKSIIGELYKRYTHLVVGVCMKYLKDEDKAKDAAMQVFEKLFTDLLEHNIENFKGWLHTVAKNHCLMQLRSEQSLQNKKSEFKKDLPVIMEMNTFSHHDVVKEKELNYLEEGLKKLNEEQKICVELFYLKEKSYDEIALITGYTAMKVKSYIQNGKRNLKIYITSRHERKVK
jgi:RNA polymerase sigma factor (sigma-70 family)